jgi:flagellar basal-body rod modification protein FlgD
MTTVPPAATGVPSAASAAAAAPAGAARQLDEQSRRTITADFNTFLTLLTTQMQNQDPLQPIESTEFVAQLAQFSAVEQQIQTNERLGDLLGAMAGGAGLAQWLGRSVRGPAQAAFSGAPIEVYPPPAPAEAKGAALLVRDASGKLVAEVPYEVGATKVTWDGKTKSGDAAPAGLYTFEARHLGKDNDATTAPAEVYAKVIEARLADGAAVLALEGGGQVEAAKVTAVR